MKKLLLLLMIVPIIGFSQTSADLYADGWEDGWKDAYQSAGGSGFMTKTFTDHFDANGDYTDPYQAGYNKGSNQGRNDAAKMTTSSNFNNVKNTNQNTQNSNQKAQLQSARSTGEAVGSALGSAIANAARKKKEKKNAERELQKKEEGIKMLESGLHINIAIGDNKSTKLNKIEERCIQEIKVQSEIFDTDYEIIEIKHTEYNKRILARVEITFRLLNTEGLIIGSTIEELKSSLAELKELLDLGIFSEEEYNKSAEPIKETIKIMLKQR